MTPWRRAPAWESWPVTRFPRVAAALRRAVAGLGLDGVEADGCLLYGGFVRALFTGEPFHRVDLAFMADRGPPAGWDPLRADPPVTVRAAPCASVRELLAEADFSICQLVIHAGRVYAGRQTLEHLAGQVLSIRRSTRIPPAVTLLRTFKLALRGYVLPKTELAVLLRRIGPGRLPLDAVDLARHSDGVVTAGGTPLPQVRAAGRVAKAPGSDDEPRYAGSAGFTVRDAADFPRLARAADRLLGALRVRERGIGSLHLFGGFVRGALLEEESGDVDMVAGTAEDRRKLAEAGARPAAGTARPPRIDLNPRVFSTPYQLLNRTDFTLTQAVYAYPEGRVYLGDGFFEHSAARVLVLNPRGGELPLQSLFRIYKYAARGYVCPAETLQGVLAQYWARPAWRRWAESRLFLREDQGAVPGGHGPRLPPVPGG